MLLPGRRIGADVPPLVQTQLGLLVQLASAYLRTQLGPSGAGHRRTACAVTV